jgi:hypothetical protein
MLDQMHARVPTDQADPTDQVHWNRFDQSNDMNY